MTAAFAQGLNYLFDGSGADYMTLRYGNGNPFVFLLNGDAPILYYLVLSAVAIGGMALVITVTIGIRALIDKIRAGKAQKA
ncbi:MAG: hypothetical protein IKY44_00185 [Clostridia bacterium]|nr:hypothetical protein [Clostridia bacterium]